VPDYAARLNETPEMAASKGMEEMSAKFKEMGERLYFKHPQIMLALQ
jgi:phosphomethylpyrimidine synthase